MEAVGAGASVLAFVVLAIQSAKAAHGVFSSLQEAPADVARLADDVLFLLGILERLVTLKDAHFSAIPASEVQALENLMKSCYAAISDIAKRVASLSSFPSDRSAKRFLKNLRAVIGEKDVGRATSLIRSQAVKLNLFLALVHTQTTASEATTRHAKADEMSELLRKLVCDVEKLQFDQQRVTDKQSSASAKVRTGLRDSIRRLSALSRASDIMDAEEAEHIIDDVQTLLRATRKRAHEDSDDDDTEECGRPATLLPETVSLSKDIKLFESLTAVAGTLYLNQGRASEATEVTVVPLPCGAALRQQRYRKRLRTDEGTAMVSMRRSEWIDLDSKTGSDVGSRLSSKTRIQIRDFTGRLTFRPNQAPYLITATTTRLHAHGRTVLLPTNLSVHPVLPKSSLVFELVKNGDLQAFKELLDARAATIWDHDEDGLSLLHHAVRQVQPAMCQFLVESGLDVDEVCGPVLDTPLTLISTTQYSGPRLECASILLENGADPTIASKRTGEINEPNHVATPMQLVASIGDGSGDHYDWLMFSALVDAGATVEGVNSVEDRYQRIHFEQLWEGREHLCPYWDDAVWPASGSNADYDFERSCPECCICGEGVPTALDKVDMGVSTSDESDSGDSGDEDTDGPDEEVMDESDEESE
ncbi:hypothetical protein NKR23_g5552 [Pleurostoma richardsiae]|uniref:Fungal N-terminal domain-containing protein n=1 Tax=Pleurostoma richardsiae TaxID=41990 RepID=A0AA38RNQ9_9PEZI|nr:hypothetical protein NKR23_g5552 [Pleurostoma richardsiae]